VTSLFERRISRASRQPNGAAIAVAPLVRTSSRVVKKKGSAGAARDAKLAHRSSTMHTVLDLRVPWLACPITMDFGTLIFFGALMVISLGLGISAFLGKSASAYTLPFFGARNVFLGILILIMLLVSTLWTPISDKNSYLISYICLFFGLLFLAGGITIAVSQKANALWWRLTRRKEQNKERQYLVAMFLIFAFGFFVCFFLFYPPFISIG